MKGRTDLRRAKTPAMLLRVVVALSVFAAGAANADAADPYAQVGARTPFNKSNSLDLAQYCNGGDQIDDTSCIGRWLSDGRAQGKHLYASPGTYIYSGSRRLFNGVQIQCADPKTSVFRNAGGSGSFFVMSTSNGVSDHPYQDVRIENCGFDLNGTTSNFASVISIGGNASSSATMARNITIRGNRIFDSTQPGSMYVERDRQRQYIVILGAQDVLIENNQLSEGGRIKAGRPGNRIVIRNNTLHNINDNAITVVNLGTHSGSHYLIEKNSIVNALGSGIFFGSDGERAGTAEQRVEDITIRQNKISGNQGACISGTLPNNARRIYIEGNDCHKTSTAPFGSDSKFDSGVALSRADHSTLPVEDVTIKHNTLRSDKPGEFELGGVFVKSGQSNLCLIGNKFHVGGSYGMFFHSSSTGAGSKFGVAKLAGNVLNGATVRNSGTLSLDYSGDTRGCFEPAIEQAATQQPAPTNSSQHQHAATTGSGAHVGHTASTQPTTAAPTYHKVLANVTINGDVVVPDGQTWLIGANVQVRGNVRTNAGTIVMRPGSSLRFLGADPAKFVGGGMTYEPKFANDFGLWIGHGGKLDVRGTPKKGWNRAGTDPSWKAGDEYYIAATAATESAPRRWRPGEPIPRQQIPSQLHSRLGWVPSEWRQQGIPAEIVNVTRDVVIEGPGHIHVHGQVVAFEYVQLRNLGVKIAGKQDSGRYALHLHMMGERSRGVVIRGVASVDSGDRVFVPHSSNGVTFLDNVSVNSTDAAFWWDIGHRTDDVLVDGLAVLGVRTTRPVEDGFRRVGGLVLGGGRNMTIRNSVVSGVNNHEVPGFDWPQNVDAQGPAIWVTENLVSHNNRGPALRFWPKSRAGELHEVRRIVSYNDGMSDKNPGVRASFVNGAYDPTNLRFIDALVMGTHVVQRSGAIAGDPVQAWTNVVVHNPNGEGIWFLHSRNALRFTEFTNCHFGAKTKVRVSTIEPKNPGRPHMARFRDCGLTPNDIVFDASINPALVGSRYEIWEEGRHRWTVSVSSSRNKVVTTH